MSERSGASRPGEGSRRVAVAFRQGRPEAVEQVRQYVQRVLTFNALRIPRDDLPDLEQKVMTEVWKAATRPGFDPAAGFWGFVATVAGRSCIDALRRSRPSAELSERLADTGRDPLQRVLDEERLALAQRVLSRLEEPCRRLIELHALRRLSYREIAPLVGKSEGALRVQMHRCVDAARRMLASSGRRSSGAAKRSGRER